MVTCRLALNKLILILSGTASAAAVEEQLRPNRLVQFDDVITLSAKKRLNTESLKNRLRQLLDLYADIEAQKQLNANQQPSIENELCMVEHYGQRGV